MNNVNMDQYINEAAVLSETNNSTDVLSVTFAHLWYDVADKNREDRASYQDGRHSIVKT